MTGDTTGEADLDRRLADAVERLGHGLRSLAQRSARAQGLSPLQQQVVLALSWQPAARREVNALAAEFDVTTPTLSDAVRSLEHKELLTRSPSSDGRRRLLTLTGRGEEVAGELSTWDEPLLTALAKLPVADRATTLGSLLHLIGDLHRRGVVSVVRMCTTCRFFRPDAHEDPAAPHHCDLLRTPLPLVELRTECPEHEQAAV
ncbi:MarR family winged helix-turn-helix transcriptional regulator [Umezawaea endophytica]|uniref:MarR family winged helix-turn-helix transcriptional regulator n=1 Tax=Umezawaea endophytica TaxID=1654476 RepID=A0A9X3AH42_9PSEU|nr:MarR family winged helix-turn-helix transcriptional regulator [Umezawaea endophytica]MCS7480481.1 MarR family winged helix-turn-helix transcriptional regulator [Umezawaea endophytica]